MFMNSINFFCLKQYFLLLLLFCSFSAQSQYLDNMLIDTIGAEPIELPRYIKQHKIAKMTKVTIGDIYEENGSYQIIYIGEQNGTIDDIKEYDEHGNVLINIGFYSPERFCQYYKYEYDTSDFLKTKQKHSSQEKLSYEYNDEKLLERIKYNLRDEDTRIDRHSGDMYFYYDDKNRITKSTFSYEDYEDTISFKHDTIETLSAYYEESSAEIYISNQYITNKIILYFDENNRVGAKVDKNGKEEYEYNEAGLIVEKREYDRYYELDWRTTYFYNENNLLTHSIMKFHSSDSIKKVYIYEFH